MDYNLSLNLSFISKELRLLLEILGTENGKIETFKKEEIRNIDWDNFLKLAIHHRVFPIVYLKLIKLEELIPSNVIEALYQKFKRNTFQMLHLSSEMGQLGKLFNENQIRVLFLKGPVIASDIYGDISLRTSKDLDILVPITDLEKAEKIILNFGYVRMGETTLQNEVKWKGYHVAYFNPKKKILLEVHWRLQPLPLNVPSFNELWERKRVSNITSIPVNMLGEEDLFLYLVSHGARHGWFRLRWLLDIDYMLRKGFYLDQYNTLLKKYQIPHIVGQALILSLQLLKSPIKEEMKPLMLENHSKKLAQNTIFFIREMVPLHIITSTYNYKRYLFSLNTSYLQKTIHIILLFYPNTMDEKTLKLPKSIYFLYFPLRPLLWIWRKRKCTT
ncbi:nucleotidyltransferase family protein [Bacillus sp. SD075]|uniref:nucleotidyltransferase domain-containing protein n=1 Tax=Bacillus sp. SD075 TaxID=2781732 RepID=UPI001A961DE5|nr:nucleotidyltransferase family protein [Bacillus sp. SD075]MBO0996447.1 nucleotidyltransferase family protein [Bacillus sp. SD075]